MRCQGQLDTEPPLPVPRSDRHSGAVEAGFAQAFEVVGVVAEVRVHFEEVRVPLVQAH